MPCSFLLIFAHRQGAGGGGQAQLEAWRNCSALESNFRKSYAAVATEQGARATHTYTHTPNVATFCCRFFLHWLSEKQIAGRGNWGRGELLVDSGRWRGQSTGGTAAALPAGCVRRLTAYIIISYETCMAGEKQ